MLVWAPEWKVFREVHRPLPGVPGQTRRDWSRGHMNTMDR